MKIAILGATSVIAKDLVENLARFTDTSIALFSRQKKTVQCWIEQEKIEKRISSHEYEEFSNEDTYDAIINFVGSGDPQKTCELADTIGDITEQFDRLALDYLEVKPECKYIFFSSGVVYGSFEKPIDSDANPIVKLNNVEKTDFYALAKIRAEIGHRLKSNFSIVDLRVFNYYSRRVPIESQFLVSQIVRALVNDDLFITNKEDITRDFVGPKDVFNAVMIFLNQPCVNKSINLYSLKPVTKFQMLESMELNFNLRWKVDRSLKIFNITGSKRNYYTVDNSASLYGYTPCSTSMDLLVDEVKKLL